MANFLQIIADGFDKILKNPGDEINARITSTGRKVMKVNINNGKNKYSKTEYGNGTTVETITTKP